MGRLVDFLAEQDPRAAARMSATVRTALNSLADFSERAPVVDDVEGVRELRVRFGRYGYAIQYSVEDDLVLITHILHAREAR